MLSLFMGLLNLIPGITSAVTKITQSAYDAKVRIYQARTGASRDVAEAAINAANIQAHENTVRLSIFANNRILTLLLVLFATPILAWFWKCIVWDIITCPFIYGTTCSTDPLRGEVAEIAKLVTYFLFGAPTAVGVAKMWFAKDGKDDN